jgi:uncharacterized protein with HEPN domain
MSERTPQLFLQDILDSGDSIRSYVQGITFEQFERERMRYSAVIREFEIIGEAVGKLPGQMKDRFPDIAWQDIKDFRNLLTHEYFGVDLQIVWNTIQSDLPQLLAAVRTMVDFE